MLACRSFCSAIAPRNYPESLLPEERIEWQEHCHAKLTADSQDKEHPFWEALAEERGRPGLSTRQRHALDDLERYARVRFGEGDSNGQNPV